MKESYRGMSFSEILETGMEYPGDTRQVSEMMTESGYEISQRSLQRYRNGDTVPSLPVAEKIMETLNLEIPKSVIAESLKIGKERKLEREVYGEVFGKHIMLSEKEFGKIAKLGPGMVSDIIADRVGEFYPDTRRGFSLYVRDLIEEDIITGILKKNDSPHR